jgi:hypothetical protein
MQYHAWQRKNAFEAWNVLLREAIILINLFREWDVFCRRNPIVGLWNRMLFDNSISDGRIIEASVVQDNWDGQIEVK